MLMAGWPLAPLRALLLLTPALSVRIENAGGLGGLAMPVGETDSLGHQNGQCPTPMQKYHFPREPYLMNWTDWWQRTQVITNEMRPLSWPESSVLVLYHPGTGAVSARILGLYLRNIGFRPVYLEDVMQNTLGRELKEAVSGARAVMLIESDDIMTHIPVLASIFFAIEEGVPIIPFDIPNFDFDVFGNSCFFLDKTLTPEQKRDLEDWNVDVANLTWYVGSSLPFIISQDFNPTGERGNGESNVHGSLIRSNFLQQLDNGFRFVVPGMPKDAFFYWRDKWNSGENPKIRPYTPDDRFFVTYISHHISSAGPEARLLTMTLWTEFSFGNIFLDVTDFHDTRSDPANVAQSCTFILLLDNTTISRPFCLLETYWALRSGRPMILVEAVGKGYDRIGAAAFLHRLAVDANHTLGEGSVKFIHQFGEDLWDMQYWLANTIPDQPIYPFDPALSTAKLHQQVGEMVTHMRMAKPAVPKVSKEEYYKRLTPPSQ